MQEDLVPITFGELILEQKNVSNSENMSDLKNDIRRTSKYDKN